MTRNTETTTRRSTRLLWLCTLALACMAPLGCTQDVYDKGEGSYSLVRADLVEAHVDANKQIDYVLTDDGERLLMQTPAAPAWVQTADTVYRAALYYNKVEAQQAQAVSCSQVPVAALTPPDSLPDGMKTDPVRLESVWLARTRRYLNASLYLKTGTATGEDTQPTQHLGIVADSFAVDASGRRTLHLTLYHDQGGVPQYYSRRTYFSIPLYSLAADSVTLRIHTYDDGLVVRGFRLTD